MKAQENLTNIMGSLGWLWTHLDYLKKDNEGVIDFNMLSELVEQCVILVGQCHSRGTNFRRQRVLTALFEDRLKVKSLLKEGAHCFEKEQKVLFGGRFQMKVNETIKSKKKTKELLKEYAELIYQAYGSRQPPFRQGAHPCSSGRGHQSYQNQGFVPRDGQRSFYSRGGRDKLESGPPCDTYIQHNSETKNTRPFKFKRLQKSSPICKNTFQGDQKNFSSSGKVKYFLKNWEKVTNDSTILSIVKGYSIDFVEIPYQPRTSIRAKLNQVQEELVSQKTKEILEKGTIRETIHYKEQFVSHLFLVSKKDGG